MADDVYIFTEQTYEHLARAGVSPMAVVDVLYGAPTGRRHVGSSFQVAGQARDGAWLVVALVESDIDDEYTVTGARRLDDDEIEVISRMIRKGKR